MNVYRELQISGEPASLASLVASIESSLGNGWTRDRQAEALGRVNGHDERRFCFSCVSTRDRRAAILVLCERAPDAIYVSNIVPRDDQRLSHAEYNRILEEFCTRFVEPNAAQLGVKVDMTSEQANLETWLSPAAAEKLRQFSAAANKSTGASHPDDQQRWLDFLVTVHRDGSTLDGSSLRRWLTETEHWPDEVAVGLVSEYELGRELLAYADR